MRTTLRSKAGKYAPLTSAPNPYAPTAGPWNYFRTSGDVAASYDSVVGNLQTTIQWAKGGLSKPGCWG